MKNPNARSILGGLALVPVLGLPALAQQAPRLGAHHLGPHPLFGPWAWGAAGVLFLLRLVLLVGLIAVVWRLLGLRRVWKRPDSATQVLCERYARGEIGEDEYQKRLATLS